MLKMLMNLLFIGCTLNSFSQNSAPPPRNKIKIMLLGTYHFANPGADKFNVKADDYLAKGRQQEIESLVNALAEADPQKIFIESGVKWQSEADGFFQQYKQGKVDIQQKGMVGEQFQVGLRLAKQLNNAHIYCVDAAGNWFENRVKTYADSTRTYDYADFEKKTKSYVDSLSAYFARHTIKENLFLLNDPKEQLANNHFMYNYVFPRIGAGDTYIGADLVGEWYKRNVRIYANVLNNVSPTDERVLLLFGNGHIHILRQLFADNPDFELVDTRKYLK